MADTIIDYAFDLWAERIRRDYRDNPEIEQYIARMRENGEWREAAIPEYWLSN